MSLDEIIKSSLKRSSNMELYLFNSIPVLIKDPFVSSENISLKSVLSKIESILPRQLSYGVDAIYIGEFDILLDKELTAAYNDGAIYVSNFQSGEDDLLDDIIHEFAHAVEETYGNDIYMDGQIEREFLGKRERLYNILNEHLPPGTNLPREEYMNPDYTDKFDWFLYKEIGYPTLRSLTSGLFYSPYGVTSLREYFANGFEAYIIRQDMNYLRKISPHLYEKIELLKEG